MKKILSSFLAFAIVFALLPIGAFAVSDSSNYSAVSSGYIEASLSNESENTQTSSRTTGVRPGQGTNSDFNINKTGLPIVNNKVEFEIMGIATTAAVDFDQMSFFSYMEKATNVKINFIGVAESKLGERKALVMQSGDYPDMFTFYYNSFTDYELYKYGKEGAIVDLMENDYLETYAPNAYASLEGDPTTKALNMDADGHVYTLPGPSSKEEDYLHWLNINKTWLNKLGLKTPTTTTDFLNVMRAFRDRDPNGNGQKDEVPFALWNWGGGFITSFWGVSIGEGNCGIDNSGKVYYAPTTENTHQACLWWNQFKTEAGLMDASVVGSSEGFWAKFTNHIQSGKVGCFVWSYLEGESFDPNLLKNYEAIAFPTANFTNPNGLDLPKVCNPYNMTPTRGNRIITKACTNVPALLRFFDLFYQDDYIMAASYGDPALGLYKKNSDGSYELTEKGVTVGANEGPSWLMGLPSVKCLSKPLISQEDTQNEEYKKYLAAANETYRNAHKANPRKTLPRVMKTADEITKLKKFASFDNGTGRLASYVTGWVDISGWTTWVNELNSKGLANYVKIWQGIADRNSEYIEDIGHRKSLIEKVDATCTTDGYRLYTCTCGETHKSIISALGHSYANDYCDTPCDRCGLIKNADGHDYDDNCDDSCSICEYIRIAPHYYDGDNVCAPICTKCGEERMLLHDYDNDCDRICNYCQATRDTTHVYDDINDTICDVCGLERIISTSGYYTYAVENGEVVIIDFDQRIGGNIIIPETLGGYPVRVIGEKAFLDCYYIDSVVVPNGVYKIDEYAFAHCELYDITLPKSLKIVKQYAFYNSYLKEVAFKGERDLWDQIEIDNTYRGNHTLINAVKSFAYNDEYLYTVYGFNAMITGYYGDSTEIIIPSTIEGYDVTRIDTDAFYGNKTLVSVTIPDSITYIGNYAFRECTLLTSIRILGMDVSISEYTLPTNSIILCYKGSTVDQFCSTNDFKWLSYIDGTDEESIVSGKVGRYRWSLDKRSGQLELAGSGALIDFLVIPAPWYDYRGYITSISLPDGITKIGENSFKDCFNLKTITIPNGVTTIGAYAFSYCYSLANITIPNSVTSIGDYAFHNCKNLTCVTIPNSVTSIGRYVFSYCKNLTSITLSNSITSISDGTFNDCISLESVTVPNSVTSIGEGAFSCCESLASITIGKGIKNIEDFAFENCTSLEKVNITDLAVWCNVCFEDIFSNPLYYAKNLYLNEELVTELVIPNGVEIINYGTFHNCDSITSVTIPRSVRRIESHAFWDCSSLKDIIVYSKDCEFDTYCWFNYNHVLYGYIGSTAETFSEIIGAEFIDIEKNHSHTWQGDCIKGVECIFCGYIGDSELGHNYQTTIVSPTCSEKGFTTYTCTYCEKTHTADYVDVIEHSYVDTVIPPSKTQQGYTEHTCSVCGDSYKDNYKDFNKMVSGVKVTEGDVSITVSWDAFEGADRYVVKALKPDGTALTTKTVVGDTSVEITGFEYDTVYTFFVVARVGGKYQTQEDAYLVTGQLKLGDRVVGIKSSVKGRTITVEWMAFPGADRYYVMVYPKGADPTVSSNRITTVNAGNKTSVDIINAISPETDYEIYVSARVGGKYQSLANALYTSAVIPVTAPNSYEITSIEPTVARIKWNAVKNADRYWARLLAEDGETIVMTKQSLKALISFTGLTPGKTYYVQLQARVPKSSGGNQYSGYCDPILTQPITLPTE